MLNILLALRVWGDDFWQHSTAFLFCDNLGVVQVVETSKNKDPFLAACIRNIWLITATLDIELQITHVRGVDNDIGDFLSILCSLKSINRVRYQERKESYIWHRIPISYFNLDLHI